MLGSARTRDLEGRCELTVGVVAQRLVQTLDGDLAGALVTPDRGLSTHELDVAEVLDVDLQRPLEGVVGLLRRRVHVGAEVVEHDQSPCLELVRLESVPVGVAQTTGVVLGLALAGRATPAGLGGICLARTVSPLELGAGSLLLTHGVVFHSAGFV